MLNLRHRYKTAADPISYSGLSKIKSHLGRVGITALKKQLAYIPEYTNFREQKKPKRRNPFYIYSWRRQIQIDLIDFQKISKNNDGVKYLLAGIDCFSKYLVVVPMRSKSAENSLAALTIMIDRFRPFPPGLEILCDRGSEFRNKKVMDYLKKEKIKQTFSTSDLKASIVERVNKSIQTRIYKHIHNRNDLRYIDDLESVVSAYNNAIHSTIKMSPKEAELPENHVNVRSNLGEFYFRRRKKPRFKINDVVLIAKANTKFSRSYQTSQTLEPFTIIKVKSRMPIPMYELKSLVENDKIEGGFYGSELTLVKRLRGKIERENEKKIFVNWSDFPKSSWISIDFKPYFNNNGYE